MMHDLRDIAWPDGLRLLMLAPHPDDFDAIGVTLRWFRERGHDLALAVVSGSASGVLDEFCPPAQKAARREAEQLASARFFGLAAEAVTFLRLPEDEDGAPHEDEANELAIARLLADSQPDLVFLPHGEDTNLGHQRVYGMFCRNAAPGCRALLIRDPKTTLFRTDLYLPFGEPEALWKRSLLRHHLSQEHRNRLWRNQGFDDRILAVNAQIAAELELDQPFAEAFMLRSFSAG